MILRSQNKYLYLIYTYDSNIIIHRYKYNKNTYTLSYYLTEIEDFVIQRVKQLRIEKGMSQRVFADNINLSQGFIRDCESPHKRAKYNINHLNEIAKVFECSFSYFFPDKPF